MKMIKHPEELSACQDETLANVERFDVVMRLSVENAELLWKAAAAHALTFRECTDCDVEDMLGPFEAPSVADCIAMLIGPRALDGCGFEAFEILPVEIAVGPSAGRAGGRRAFMSHSPRIATFDQKVEQDTGARRMGDRGAASRL